MQQTYGVVEIFMIDNASSDGSASFVKNNYPNVNVIENQNNVGFAPAMNQGIRLASGGYIMSLNADIYLTPSYIENMISALNRGPDIGSAAGKIYKMTPDGELKTNIDAVGHYIKKDRKVVGNRPGMPNRDNDHNAQSRFVFGTSGCASIYKRKMLEDTKLGGDYFDRDYFAFFEDVDLDWRALLYGWKCIYTPDAVCYHVRGASEHRKNPEIEALILRNGYLTILKNDGLINVLGSIGHIASRMYNETLSSTNVKFWLPFHTAKIFLKTLPRMARKRIAIHANRRVAPNMIEKWLQ